jgi:hypothetical protein
VCVCVCECVCRTKVFPTKASVSKDRQTDLYITLLLARSAVTRLFRSKEFW